MPPCSTRCMVSYGDHDGSAVHARLSSTQKVSRCGAQITEYLCHPLNLPLVKWVCLLSPGPSCTVFCSTVLDGPGNSAMSISSPALGAPSLGQSRMAKLWCAST